MQHYKYLDLLYVRQKNDIFPVHFCFTLEFLMPTNQGCGVGVSRSHSNEPGVGVGVGEPPIVVSTPTPERLLWHSLPMKLLICCLSGIKFGQFCIYFFSSKNSWPLLRASAKREASFYWCLIYTKNLSMSGRSAVVTLLLRASAKRETSFYWHTLKIWVWAAGRSW